MPVTKTETPVAPPGFTPLAEMAMEAIDRLAGDLFCAGGPPRAAMARIRRHDGPHAGYADPVAPHGPLPDEAEPGPERPGTLSLY
jgi:hypothetical protein